MLLSGALTCRSITSLFSSQHGRKWLTKRWLYRLHCRAWVLYVVHSDDTSACALQHRELYVLGPIQFALTKNTTLGRILSCTRTDRIKQISNHSARYMFRELRRVRRLEGTMLGTIPCNIFRSIHVPSFSSFCVAANYDLRCGLNMIRSPWDNWDKAIEWAGRSRWTIKCIFSNFRIQENDFGLRTRQTGSVALREE